MARRIPAIIATFIVLAVASAQTLVVYPFQSDDPLLGTVVSDAVANSLASEVEVYGPAVAPSLVPPMPVAEGFLNPTEYLQGQGVANRSGSALLRDALGADAVLSGTVRLEEDRLQAHLYLASGDTVEEFISTSAEDDPGDLARRITEAVARREGIEWERTATPLDLSTSDGEVARALTLISAGLVDEARNVLAQVQEPGERVEELLAALSSEVDDPARHDPALLATVALNRVPLDEEFSYRQFTRLARESELPAADLWAAVLLASLGDSEGAAEIFASLPADYGYGQVAGSAFLTGRGAGLGEAEDPDPEAYAAEGDVAALLGISALAFETGDVELEKAALQRLTRVAPFLPYPFERLSFIAFDEDDPLSAAQALVVAVDLEPESDLYWTNLGWSYYLLGMLEASEEASLRAISIDPSQYIAHYNLGLVRAVTGRLQEANEAYLQALRVDPEVDDAAVEDLEEALILYPDEPAVVYSLALLYEAEGRRAQAAEQYRNYLSRGSDETFVARAQEREEILSAPPPPIELTDGVVTIGLGQRGIAGAPYHPGDPLFPSFEVYTPGEELPGTLNVGYELVDADGEPVLEAEEQVEVPRAAVALVISSVELRLPEDLPAGAYRLDVTVSASEERRASGSVLFEVTGEPELLRQLLGRNITLQSLDTGQQLYGEEQLAAPGNVIDILLQELRANAGVAEEVLPAIESGPFEGLTGGELFAEASEGDIERFLGYLIEGGVEDASLVFVDAYAQWALEGAPGSGAGE